MKARIGKMSMEKHNIRKRDNLISSNFFPDDADLGIKKFSHFAMMAEELKEKILKINLVKFSSTVLPCRLL